MHTYMCVFNDSRYKIHFLLKISVKKNLESWNIRALYMAIYLRGLICLLLNIMEKRPRVCVSDSSDVVRWLILHDHQIYDVLLWGTSKSRETYVDQLICILLGTSSLGTSKCFAAQLPKNFLLKQLLIRAQRKWIHKD